MSSAGDEPGADRSDAPIDAGIAPKATRCSAAGDCPTGFCVDGFCCELACKDVCEACNLPEREGTCFKIRLAPDPDTCVAPMACGVESRCKKATGQACSASADCASDVCKDGFCCDTACLTPCQSCGLPGKVGTCSPITAGPDAPECDGVCDAAGKCLHANGKACTDAGQCTSGFCVDGFCCNEACTGTCRACRLTKGTCINVPKGYDLDDECPGSCDVAGTCKAATGACDGKGACGTLIDCGNFSCGTAGCITSCNSNLDCCGSGRYCAEGGYASLACSATVSESTSSANQNFTFTGLCTMEAGSDRLATGVWAGFEYVYQIVAPATQTLELKLHQPGTARPDLDLFIFEAEACTAMGPLGIPGSCCTTISGCRASAHSSTSTDEVVRIAAVSGKKYYVVIDSTATGAAAFDLTLSCL